MTKEKPEETRKALLVLESSWTPISQNTSQPSVLPVMQMLERFWPDHLKVYYAQFLDKKSFGYLLERFLEDIPEGKVYIYIAAHGGKAVLGGDFSEDPSKNIGINLSSVVRILLEQATAHKEKLDGVMFGTCNIGKNIAYLKDLLKRESGFNWVYGYKCKIDMLMSTMIDAAVVQKCIIECDPKTDLETSKSILRMFQKAMEPFNLEANIEGWDDYSEGHKVLGDNLTLLCRGDALRQRLTDQSAGLFEQHEDTIYEWAQFLKENGHLDD